MKRTAASTYNSHHYITKMVIRILFYFILLAHLSIFSHSNIQQISKQACVDDVMKSFSFTILLVNKSLGNFIFLDLISHALVYTTLSYQHTFKLLLRKKCIIIFSWFISQTFIKFRNIRGLKNNFFLGRFSTKIH